MPENGKGDGTRPRFIPEDQWAKNHELAFGKHIPWYERRAKDEGDSTPERSDFDPRSGRTAST